MQASTVVGYSTVNNGKIDGAVKSRYTVGGSSFISIGGEGYCLRDFKIVGGNNNKEIVSFVQTTAAKVDNALTYYWYNGSGTKAAGWMYLNTAGGHTKNSYVSDADLDAVIPAGVGFMCNFQTEGASLQYAGQVNVGTDDGEGKKVIDCGRNGRYTFLVNPLPRDVSLSEIKIVNGNNNKEIISFLQTDAAKVDNAKAYYWFNGTSTKAAGWMYLNTAGGHSKNTYVEETVTIHQGEGFLFNSQTAAAKVQFPGIEL